jgi:hypothetical protein
MSKQITKGLWYTVKTDGRGRFICDVNLQYFAVRKLKIFTILYRPIIFLLLLNDLWSEILRTSGVAVSLVSFNVLHQWTRSRNGQPLSILVQYPPKTNQK